MQYFIILLLIISGHFLSAQSNYTSYFTGNSTDITTNPQGGICIMGGATEHDEAMKWFLNAADGGDVLVLRASGSNGYNDYLFSELGVPVNSVESIVCHDATASNEAYIHQKIMNAEAIWLAGGDQWKYISYWRNTAIDSLINDAITNRNIVIGGTSAGMAVMGGFYFSAENGTVTSTTALQNPYHERVVIDSSHFIGNEYLEQVITDTHYDDPDRRGRHATFLARIYTDYGIAAKGIACDEYTAVCIAPNGLARIYGEYPTRDDNAYFLQTNCELPDISPENCTADSPLVWNREQKALKVYKVKGVHDGSNVFDLTDWKSGHGGSWENWWIENGNLHTGTGEQINCNLSATANKKINIPVTLSPNPCLNTLRIETFNSKITGLLIFDLDGKLTFSRKEINKMTDTIDVRNLKTGYYTVQIWTEEGLAFRKLIKK